MSDRINEVKEFLRDLVAFPTISCDSNLALISYLSERLESCGAQVEVLGSEDGKKANLFATIGPEGDGGLVLSGHTDVVPVEGQNWTSDPFVMAERDGALYGRGTCDMKGFIATCVAMAPLFAQKISTRPLHFAFTFDEEVSCLGAQELARMLTDKGIRPSAAIIGEPTSMKIIEGHKGCYEYTTRFQGLEGHGSNPDAGVNAVEYAVRYVSKLLELGQDLKTMVPAGSKFEPPWTTINVGALNGGVAHNVIPNTAEIEWEMRPVQASDATHVKSTLRRYCEDVLLPRMQDVYPDAEIETEVLGEIDGLEPVDENTAREIVAELTGQNHAGLVPFGTEAGIYQKLGMDVVVCGPGSIDQAHKANEYVTISQLSDCVAMLERLADRLSTS